jgi:hypothetical protein
MWYASFMNPDLDRPFADAGKLSDIFCGRQLIKLIFDALYGRAR